MLVSYAGFGQAASATWAGTSNLNASISGSNIAATAVTASGATGINSSTNGVTSSNWTTNNNMQSGYYYQYQVTPTTGNTFTFTGISVAHSVAAGTSWGGAVYYSTNGFTSSTQIGSGFAPATTEATFAQSGLSVVVTAGTTLTIRLYAWDAPTTNRVFRAKNMVISGTTCGTLTFGTQPTGETLCAGGTISLTSSAANAVSYQWKKDNVNISGATSATYSKSNATTADSGSYTVVATNACTSVTSSAATVTVNPAPTSVTANASATTVCAGTSVNLTSSATSNSPSGAITVLSENFNGATNTFTATNNTTGGTNNAGAAWTLRPEGYSYSTSTTVTFSSNDNSQFYLTNSDPPGEGATTSTTLQSPSFSTVGLSAANLSFYHYYRRYDGNESGKVEVSTNGTSWTTLATYTTNQGASGTFANVSISLASYLNQATVYIRFKYDATFDYYWAIDNVSVTGTGVPAPTYSWTSSPAGFTSNLQNPTVTPTQNTTYTVTVSNSYGCSASASTALVTVNPTSVGGNVAGSTAVCAPTNSGTLTLSGHIGNVIRWESSANNFATAGTTINNTTTTLNYSNLTATTYYRAVVQSGVCATANSAVATVTVNPASVGGSVAGSATVCAPTNSGTLTLSGHVGTVIGWESSTNNFTTAGTPISNTTTSLNYSNLSVTTYYRAIVQSASCASANSAVATITVNPASVGGTVSGTTTLCGTTNSGTLTLSANVGNVIGWESSTNNFATAGTPIANTTTSLNYNNLSVTTYYRAIVQSGSCASAYSSVATVTVAPVNVAGTLSGDATYCSHTNSGMLNLNGYTGTTFAWEYSLDNFATAGIPIVNNTSSLNYSNLNATTYYRVLIGNGVCAGAYCNVIAITVNSNSTWTGAVSSQWHNAANWSCGEVPQSYTDVLIPSTANQPIITADAFAKTVTLQSGTLLTLLSGNDFTVTGAITSSGNFTIENNANLIQIDNVANTGTSKVKRNSAALMRQDYTLWSSPVSGQNLLPFSPQTLTNRFYTYNSITNLFNTIANPNTTEFATGSGYMIRMPNNHPTTPTVWNGEFNGTLRNGNIDVTLSNNGAGQRFNLVGNPYPSAIDMETFVNDNAANITGALYFWRKTNNPISPSYCSWTSGGGFVTNNEAQVADPDGAIRTGQGFIVEASAAGTQVVFNNGQRSGDNSNHFFRSANEIERNRIWLNATNTTGAFSQTLVGYITGSTLDNDSGIDGRFMNDGEVSFYSLIAEDRFVIQGRPLPFVDTDVVPMGFKATNAGSYSIAIDHVDGLFAQGQDIFVRDNLTGTVHDLNSGAYAFASEAGTFNGRFELLYQNALSTHDPIFDENSVIVYKQSESFVINSGNMNMASVKVYDVLGKLVKAINDINSSEISFTVNGANQMLVFRIYSDQGEQVVKKVMN
ncbi:hypothetical protein HUK80_13305 [Flavobacterium sp. MAH-1]|uniref:Ig-like domain-containing protein n=1 Tax=Flavobacterium agri TaxID=2743471 RepID=A0A7Y9C6Y5_9FLAO|nr:hypothetical protein [Flavobacterium agri]NUY81875.1 hypothetical protein [Flavobacterium agri]NYA71899.1 hypothetical protein [Flavobacterium agri]